jgi:hypothetical protein
VSDNRETLYTVAGAATNTVALNVANNVSNLVTLPNAQPSSFGELTISLAPGPNNNNANHFTYLGVLKLELLPLPRHLPPQVQDGRISLHWTGAGFLEWAPEINGPWTSIATGTNSPYSEPLLPIGSRFFRLRQ